MRSTGSSATTTAAKAMLLASAAAALVGAGQARAQAPSSLPPSAQTPSAQTPSAAGPASAVGEVVVTAQRREQSAQDVGISISVLTGTELALRGVNTVEGLQYQTPGLEITPQFGGGQPAYRLRGVGFDDYASNNASPVGIYVDEVAYPFPIQTTGQIFDIARVEVLRGPQGTLYGRNTTGGAINFISNRPTANFQAGFDGEGGSYGYGKAEGFVSGPVTDALRLRLAGITEQGGGFEHQRYTGVDFGALDRYALRGQAELAPAGPFSADLEVSYSHDGSDGGGLYLLQPVNTPAGIIAADRNHFNTGWGSSSTFSSLTGVAPGAKPFRDDTNGGVDLRLGYDLGFAKLTNIVAFHDLDRREYEDWDATSVHYAGVYFRSRANVLSEELRLNSEREGPFKWIVGAYYSRERLRESYLSDLIDGLGFDTKNTYHQQADDEALFGQADYQITSKLALTGGFRVEHEERKLLDYTTTTDPVIPLGGGINLGVTGVNSGLSYTKPSGKVELNYKLTPSTLLYLSDSYGIKSGAFSAYNTVQANQLEAVKPEELWAYEGGFKSEFFARRLRVNGAAYYYDYRNQQVQSAVVTFAGPIGNIVNAPRSRIYGVELEVDAHPLPRLEIDNSVSYKRGDFISYTGLDAVNSTFVNRNGQDEGFPKLDYNGSISYGIPIGEHLLTAESDWSYRGKNSPVLLGPPYDLYDVAGYWLLNATLTFAPTHGPWSVGLWVRNLTDTRYDLTRNFFTADSAGRLISIAAPGTPITAGARVTYKY